MAPTFLTAAGIDISTPDYSYLDGRDLAQTAAGVVPPRDYIIAEPTWVTGPRAVILPFPHTRLPLPPRSHRLFRGADRWPSNV